VFSIVFEDAILLRFSATNGYTGTFDLGTPTRAGDYWVALADGSFVAGGGNGGSYGEGSQDGVEVRHGDDVLAFEVPPLDPDERWAGEFSSGTGFEFIMMIYGEGEPGSLTLTPSNGGVLEVTTISHDVHIIDRRDAGSDLAIHAAPWRTGPSVAPDNRWSIDRSDALVHAFTAGGFARQRPTIHVDGEHVGFWPESDAIRTFYGVSVDRDVAVTFPPASVDVLGLLVAYAVVGIEPR